MPTMTKEYMKNYLAAAHAESIECQICGGKYKKYFKSVHVRGKKHTIANQKKEATAMEAMTKRYEELQKKFAEAENKLRLLKVD